MQNYMAPAYHAKLCNRTKAGPLQCFEILRVRAIAQQENKLSWKLEQMKTQWQKKLINVL